MTLRGVRKEVVRANDDTLALDSEETRPPTAGALEAAAPVAVFEMIQTEEAERPCNGCMKVWIMGVIVLALGAFTGAAGHATCGAPTGNLCVCVSIPEQ